MLIPQIIILLLQQKITNPKAVQMNLITCLFVGLLLQRVRDFALWWSIATTWGMVAPKRSQCCTLWHVSEPKAPCAAGWSYSTIKISSNATSSQCKEFRLWLTNLSWSWGSDINSNANSRWRMAGRTTAIAYAWPKRHGALCREHHLESLLLKYFTVAGISFNNTGISVKAGQWSAWTEPQIFSSHNPTWEEKWCQTFEWHDILAGVTSYIYITFWYICRMSL